jgi:putative FmdB family regulatory protein
MPIYEYECRKCGHRFEYLVLSTTPAAKCPACNKKDLKQLISMYAVSSETTRQASLSVAKKKAAKAHKEKAAEEHKALHDHYDH